MNKHFDFFGHTHFHKPNGRCMAQLCNRFHHLYVGNRWICEECENEITILMRKPFNHIEIASIAMECHKCKNSFIAETQFEPNLPSLPYNMEEIFQLHAQHKKTISIRCNNDVKFFYTQRCNCRTKVEVISYGCNIDEINFICTFCEIV